MKLPISDILNFLDKANIGYDFAGRKDIIISKYTSIKNVERNTITWIKNKKFYDESSIKKQSEILLVVKDDIEIDANVLGNIGIIKSDNPKETFFSILNNFFSKDKAKSFVSNTAVVNTKNIGENVYIGHHTFIDDEVEIGNNVIIKNNVSIEGKVRIGDNTIIHSGVVIGTDGFGYYKNEDGLNLKVPHYGGVVIGSDVEIGANTCIDRGTLDDTIIGDNVKIDNLCQIAHNVMIKRNTLIAGNTSVAGSTIIGANTWIGSSSISNGLVIGENCYIVMGSVVISNVRDNKKVFGNPARVYDGNE